MVKRITFLLILFTGASGVQLQASWSLRIHDRIEQLAESEFVRMVQNVLKSSANGYCQNKDVMHNFYRNRTHEFLGYLGYKNPEQMPVYAMADDDTRKKTANGYTDGERIVLNFSSGDINKKRLFTCAHEAAHCVLKHPWQHNRLSIEKEREADILAARMLCAHGYRWVVVDEAMCVFYLVLLGQEQDDVGRPSCKEKYSYLSAVLRDTQEDCNTLVHVAVQWSKEFDNKALIDCVQHYQLPVVNKEKMIRHLYAQYATRLLVAGSVGLGLAYAWHKRPRTNIFARWVHAQNPQIPAYNVQTTTHRVNPPVHRVYTTHQTVVLPQGYNPTVHIPVPQANDTFYQQTPGGNIPITREQFAGLLRNLRN